ncbi:MAG TPA: AAA family ATPase [Solirubrobacteraceae bacterium]|nr:AAA family ATPase [Solirubrobacteraceae bacterium]
MDTDPALLEALAAPEMYGGAGARVQVHETHGSRVFVAGEHAYKVKKPLALGFLDYSTLERRRAACREEVRVNRELAGDLYVGVRAIVSTPEGFAFAPDDAPDAVEYAVQMRSFREEDTLAGLIARGSLTRAHIDAVARRLASFHRHAPAAGGGGPLKLLERWQTNVAELARLSPPGDWHVEVAQAFGESFVRMHAPEIERRVDSGLIRCGHGDLRCDHVLAVPSVRVVDSIEFDPALRCMDVAFDLAFLMMDLQAHGQRWAARELLAAYRDAGIDPGGARLRSFYAAHWAIVRAKVALIDAREHRDGGPGDERIEEARARWRLGEELCWGARGPLAIVVCGPAGSGKSTLAAELSRRSQMAILSSDVVRKRSAGLAAADRARPELYGRQRTRATYELLGREALLQLRRGEGAIVDATCRSHADRAPLLAQLRQGDTRILFVRCEVPLAVALERAARRMGDVARVSDATPEIAAEQFRSFQELDELPAEQVLGLDAGQPLHAQVAAVALAVDRLPAPGDGASADGPAGG